MKYKTLIILSILILLIFFSGITYSIFNSNAKMNSDQDVAKFIFDAEKLNESQTFLIDLEPGDNEEYAFSVSNNYMGKISDVSLEYQITIKTYHLAPLIIELYKMNEEEEEELILTCDENYTRNLQNELVCDTPTQEMGYSSEEINNYKIKIKFPSEYNDVVYSGLVDYINLEIKSVQKTEE